jgi:hypothetical protein
MDANVIRNLRLEGWLFSLSVFVPEVIDALKGLLRDLNPKPHVVRQFSFDDWKRQEGSYEKPRSVKGAKIVALLYAGFSLFSAKCGYDIRPPKRQFKVFERVLLPAFGADGHGSVVLCGLTFELKPTTEVGGVRLGCDDA